MTRRTRQTKPWRAAISLPLVVLLAAAATACGVNPIAPTAVSSEPGPAATTATTAASPAAPLSAAAGDATARDTAGGDVSTPLNDHDDPVLEARGDDCTVSLNRRSGSVHVGLGGRTFFLDIRFPRARNPERCAWRIRNTDLHNLIIRPPSGVASTSLADEGPARIEIRVLPSRKDPRDRVQTVHSNFRITAPGQTIPWVLRVDRYCPTLGWCS